MLAILRCMVELVHCIANFKIIVGVIYKTFNVNV